MLLLLISVVCFQSIVDARNVNTLLHVENNSLLFKLIRDNTTIFLSELGVPFKNPISDCGSGCFDFGTAQLHHKQTNNIHHFQWNIKSNVNQSDVVLTDCISLLNFSWYGGPEQKQQLWPVNNFQLNKFPMVTQENENSAVIENYWLNEAGVYIHVDHLTPLFINQTVNETICFIASLEGPYIHQHHLQLQYRIVVEENVRDAQIHAQNHAWIKPIQVPNYDMFYYPIWSTWVEYKRDINQTIIIDFAERLKYNNYSGKIEIDDSWEICYGALEFDSTRFPDPAAMIRQLTASGFLSSLWVHPFINFDCEPWFSYAANHSYLVRNSDGDVLTQWWNSGKRQAALIDFTNPAAAQWWTSRLQKIQFHYGLNIFKCDAGESSWAPQVPNFYSNQTPNSFTEAYVINCRVFFGGSNEVRVGYNTQYLPMMVRMIDKDTKWSFNNGLKSLITTMLQMNILGYPFVMPDMIGGNEYENDTITPELFVRWLQANIFMPSIQFSIVPWRFNNNDFDVNKITQKFLDLRNLYKNEILNAAEEYLHSGKPMNPPIWWIDPTDSKTFGINDEFLLGEKYLIAPVVEEGARSRDIYLPHGFWQDGNNKTQHYLGPVHLREYFVPIDVLPYFILINK